MFYSIKIKSNLNEYSLDSSDKTVIQREMDLYFDSFFGASNEFKSKIPKIVHTSFSQDEVNPSYTYNSAREEYINSKSQKQENTNQLKSIYDIPKDDYLADKNIQENTQDNDLSVNNNFSPYDSSAKIDSGVRILKDVSSEQFEKYNTNSYPVNSSEMRVHNSLSEFDEMPTLGQDYDVSVVGSDFIEPNNVPVYNNSTPVDNVVIQNNANNTLNDKLSNDLKLSSVSKDKADMEQNIISTKYKDNISANQNDYVVEKNEFDSNNASSDYIEPQLNHNEIKVEDINKNADIKPDLNASGAYSQNDNNQSFEVDKEAYEEFLRFKEERLQANTISVGNADNIQNSVNNNNASNTQNEINNTPADNKLNETANYSTTSEFEIKPGNSSSDDVVSEIPVLVDDGEVKNVTKTDVSDEYNIQEFPVKQNSISNADVYNSLGLNAVDDKLPNDSSDLNSDFSYDSSNNENQDLSDIVNMVETSINNTDITNEFKSENLMNMFEMTKNIDNDNNLSESMFDTETIENSNYYKEDLKSEGKNQELIKNIFSNDNSGTNSIQNIVTNVVSDNSQMPAIDSDNTIKPSVETNSNNSQSDNPVVSDTPNTAGSGAVLDFKLFKAGFIAQDLVDDFLICSYYIKHILRKDSFTMKFINSKLYAATGKFADMCILDELVVKGYIKEVNVDSQMQYAITQDGERYFVATFQN